MCLKSHTTTLLISLVFCQFLLAADLNDIRDVNGTAVRTIDGELADWNVGDKIVSRSDFLAPGFARTSSWAESDGDVRTDVYASYHNYHLYVAVDMDNVASDAPTSPDFGTTGVEVYLLVNKDRPDKYCWQVIAHLQNGPPVQLAFLHQPGGSIEENDTDENLSLFFDGAVKAAHQINVAGVFADRYLRAEWDFDLAQMGVLFDGIDFFAGDSVAIAVFARGQKQYRQGIIWGGDGRGAFQEGWLPTQDYENAMQGFTGAFRFTPAAPSVCNELQNSAKDASDVNQDCMVNLADFAILTENWLDCSHPNGIDCQDLL